MRNLIIIVGLWFTGVTFSGAQESKSDPIKTNKMETAKTNIEKVLYTYQDALNASSTVNVLPIYTEGGVFMPQGGPSAVGQEELKEAYDFVFKTLRLNVKFMIEEIILINDQYAIARTISSGTQILLATNELSAEENRELFILQQEGGQWKIAKYMFNKMK